MIMKKLLKSKTVALYLFPVAAVKIATTGWLRTTEMYPPTVLEARSLKSVSLGRHRGAGRAELPPEDRGEDVFMVSSGFWGCQHSWAAAPEMFIHHFLKVGRQKRMQNFKIENMPLKIALCSRKCNYLLAASRPLLF